MPKRRAKDRNNVEAKSIKLRISAYVLVKGDPQLDTIYHHPPLSFQARSMVHNDVDISSSSSHKILPTSTIIDALPIPSNFPIDI